MFYFRILTPPSPPPPRPSQLQLISQVISSSHLTIGDDGIPQSCSDALSSAHLSAQLQLTLSYWRRRDPPVSLRIPQLNSALSSAPAHTLLLATTESASLPQMPSFSLHFLLGSFFLVSGEAILGTQRYLQLTLPYWRRRNAPMFIRVL